MASSHSPPLPTHLLITSINSTIAMPEFSLPAPYMYSLTEYGVTMIGQPTDKIIPLLRGSEVLITSGLSITTQLLDGVPELRAIFVLGSGYDYIDLDACRARGIHVANAPGGNSDGVAEHAIALYFAARRAVPLMHKTVASCDWRSDRMTMADLMAAFKDASGEFPRMASDEVIGIVGYGAVGKHVERLARALGMKVLIAARKGAEPVPDGRTAFETVVREASLLVIGCPLTPETVDLISDAELDAMPTHAVLVNVSRGSIVNERALADALKQRKIWGAALDVFGIEPARPETCPLLGEGMDKVNLVMTPHMGWASSHLTRNFQACAKENINSWLEGKPLNKVV